MMKTVKKISLSLFLVLVLSLYSLLGTAFTGTTTKFTDFSKAINVNRIFSVLSTISTDYTSRIAGFETSEKAGQYLEGQFKSIGLSVKEQKFPFKAFKCNGTEVAINFPDNKVIKSSYLMYTKETAAEGISSGLVYVGMGSYDDLKKVDVKGKIVLMLRGGEYFRGKTDRVASLGAIGAVFYDPNSEDMIAATLVQPSKIPAVVILKADGEALKSQLEASKQINMTIKVNAINKDGTTKNIIASLKPKGIKTDKTLIIGAHYDGMACDAANDNGSGVAVMLEVARILDKQKINCNIDFIGFGAEENGTYGSQYYVSSLSSKQQSNIVGMMNLDMVGAGDTMYLHTLSDFANSPIADLSENCIKAFGYKYQRSGQDRSDHVAFENVGIPAAYFEYGPDNNYHTVRDVAAAIKKDDLMRITKVVSAVALEVSKNPKKYSK